MKKFLDRMKSLQGSLTQREFAKSIGIPLNSYTNWFLYDRKPSIDTLFSICTKLCVSADWLLGLTDERAPGAGTSSDARIAELEKKILQLESANDALQKALAIVGGRPARPVRTGGAPAAKIA